MYVCCVYYRLVAVAYHLGPSKLQGVMDGNTLPSPVSEADVTSIQDDAYIFLVKQRYTGTGKSQQPVG